MQYNEGLKALVVQSKNFTFFSTSSVMMSLACTSIVIRAQITALIRCGSWPRTIAASLLRSLKHFVSNSFIDVGNFGMLSMASVASLHHIIWATVNTTCQYQYKKISHTPIDR